MRKFKGTFAKVYISVFASLIGLLIVASTLLWSMLNAYEVTRPKYKAEEIFNEYFATENFAGFIKLATGQSDLFESDENINEKIKSKLETAEMEYFEINSESPEVFKYAVVINNKRIAEFSLKESEQKGKYGFKFCDFESGELFVTALDSAVIRVPKNYVLKLNGEKVSETYITKTDIETDSSQYVKGIADGIYYDEYTVQGLFAEPEITVEAPNGKTAEVKYNDEEKYYTASTVNDDALQKEYEQYCKDAVTAYAAYMSNDGSFDSIAKYLDKSSKIHEKVRQVEVVWVREHNGFKVSDQKATEFYKYSEDCFSCRATATNTLMRDGYKNSVEYIDIVFYLKKVNGKFLIYDIVTNS